MKSLILSVALAFALAGTAHALTLTQAQNELAGMSCSGSTCSASATISTDVDLPDISTTSTELVSPAKSGSGPVGFTTGCAPRNAMNGKPARVCQDVTRDGVPQSISSTSASPATYREVTTITDGGTETIYTCSTTTKTLTYNGPFTSRDGAWSVDSSTSSSAGSCN